MNHALNRHIQAREDLETAKRTLRTAARDLGEELKLLRKRQGLTLRGAAAQLGISAPFYNDLELGNRNPNEELTEKLRSLFYT